MNILGDVLLVISGSLVLLSICVSLLGLRTYTLYNLTRSFFVEIISKFVQNKKNSQSLISNSSKSPTINHYWLKLTFGNLNKVSIYLRGFLNLNRNELSNLGGKILLLNIIVVTASILTLTFLLIQGDMSNRYVVSHLSDDLGVFYRLTATWAGSSGSLLFWYWLLSLFCSCAVIQSKKLPSHHRPLLYIILALTQLFFIFLILFFRDAQPFRVYPIEMKAGRGINPLLLHWGMIIHPPILYLGYVSSGIPFAILISAFISGGPKESTYLLLRRWAIFSWFFLGTGILLGSKWAYEELGWGGYWAWDPVENASLMPWLILTAFLHSFIVQSRLEILRFWNVVLIILAYHMCLIGTWITRSGVLQGPHSFADSSIGKPMIIFIFLSLIYFSRFLYFLSYKLKPLRKIETITSKEGSMLLNNLVMLLSMFIILMGVFSPLLPFECDFIKGSFECYKAEWKLDNYNRLLVPLGILTLFLMGASPLLSWRQSAMKSWKKNLKWPLIWGGTSGILYALSYGVFFTAYPGPNVSTWGYEILGESLAILTVGISVFVVAGIIQEYWQGLRSRQARFSESKLRSILKLILNNKTKYVGYLAHLSIVFLFIGYSGSAFKKTKKIEFHYTKVYEPNQSDVIHYYSGDISFIENYYIQAKDFFFRPVYKLDLNSKKSPRFTFAQQAHYQVAHGLKNLALQNNTDGAQKYEEINKRPSFFYQILKLFTGIVLDGHLRTERHFYPQVDPVSGEVARNNQSHAIHIPTSKPDMRSTWFEDLYIQLGAIHIPVIENSLLKEKEASKNREIPLNHFYEAYYVLFKKDQRAYLELFPPNLVASLEIWINPLVKFIWLGSLTFFFSGLLLLIPVGEKRGKEDF